MTYSLFYVLAGFISFSNPTHAADIKVQFTDPQGMVWIRQVAHEKLPEGELLVVSETPEMHLNDTTVSDELVHRKLYNLRQIEKFNSDLDFFTNLKTFDLVRPIIFQIESKK